MNETTPDMYKCEEYFEANVMNITQGIQGMSSDAFYRNLRSVTFAIAGLGFNVQWEPENVGFLVVFHFSINCESR